jgi:hypothetical protein
MKTYNDGIQDAIDLLKTLRGNSIDYIIDRLQDYQYANDQKEPKVHTITDTDPPDESTGFSLFGDLS